MYGNEEHGLRVTVSKHTYYYLNLSNLFFRCFYKHGEKCLLIQHTSRIEPNSKRAKVMDTVWPLQKNTVPKYWPSRLKHLGRMEKLNKQTNKFEVGRK